MIYNCFVHSKGFSGTPGRNGVPGYLGDRGEAGITGDKGFPGIGFNITGKISNAIFFAHFFFYVWTKLVQSINFNGNIKYQTELYFSRSSWS